MSKSLIFDPKKLSKLRGHVQAKGAGKQLSYCIVTFGCQMNYADSEKVHMILMQAGLSRVEDWKESDIVIMNTCSVRQKAEDRVFGLIREVKKENASRDTPIRVGVTGCMTRKTGIHKKYYEYSGRKNTTNITRAIGDKSDEKGVFNCDDELFFRSENIDFIFRIEETGGLTTLLSIVMDQDVGQDDKFNDYLQIRQQREDTRSANIIIQTGCDNYCTFCIVPHTRGSEISRDIDDIVDEVRGAVGAGAREVTLLGQNVNSYGKNTRASLWNPEELTWSSSDVRTPFRELLERLDAIDGLDRIRFTSSNPHDMTRDILDAHFDLESACSYLHFALQSGDNEILQKMNRKHSYEDFKTMVEYLRSKDPFFSISTDIIVGFPGETDEQFENTVQAFRECDFDFAYIARYSPRAQTYAAKMSGAIDHTTKAYRWNVLNEELRKSIKKRNELLIDRVESLMITKREKDGQLGGRTRNFKEVFIAPDESIQIGDLVDVRITDLDGWVLRGKKVSC